MSRSVYAFSVLWFSSTKNPRFYCILFYMFIIFFLPESGGMICISRLFVYSVHVNLFTLLRDFVVKVRTFLFIGF